MSSSNHTNDQTLRPQDQLKKDAGVRAAAEIRSGMIVGLGTGSTVRFALEEIGRRIAAGELRDVVGIASSQQTEDIALRVGIPLSNLNAHPRLDIYIDGADEIDANLDAIKGGGGALLREKVLAQNCARFIVIADESKFVKHLGAGFALPVEVLPFASGAERRFLEQLGAEVTTRTQTNGDAVFTDNGNIILDCDFGAIDDPLDLAASLDGRAGIVEHGLFIALADELMLASKEGVRLLTCAVRDPQGPIA